VCLRIEINRKAADKGLGRPAKVLIVVTKKELGAVWLARL
jgi:hypothetical protein